MNEEKLANSVKLGTGAGPLSVCYIRVALGRLT